MRILITGSSGTVGSYLTEYLQAKHEIVGFDIYKPSSSQVEDVTVQGDIRNRDMVSELTKNIDVIIHLAAQLNIDYSKKNPVFDADVNIMGTLNLLDAARKQNIPRFIFFSSAAVYGQPEYLPIDEKHPLNPVSPYGLSKLTGERYGFLFNNLYSLPFTAVRPSNIYSENEKPESSFVSVISTFVSKVKKGEALDVRGDGKQQRDFVHVEDVAHFIDILLYNEATIGEVYNLGGGQPWRILDVARLVLRETGNREESGLTFNHKDDEKGGDSYFDIGKARKIGYSPSVPVEEGIQRVINNWQGKHDGK